MATSSPKHSDPVEQDREVKDEEAGDDAVEDGVDENAEGNAEGAGASEAIISLEMTKALKAVCEVLTNHKIKIKGNEDYYPSTLFRRLPNKRNLPDYYEIIKEPSALSTLKSKLTAKKYTSVAEYVRDFALIVHNAQVYNRPNSAPVRDALELKTVFEAELKKLVEVGLLAEEDTAFPDLGEIPYATPEPDPVSEEEDEGEEDGEEEDEDEDGDESDDEKRRRRARRGGRTSFPGRKTARDEEDEGGKGNDGDARKRRGRPPRVDTPMEARIKAILKGIRKPKDKGGSLKIRHFEKLPDKQANPHYFIEIKEPIAIDLIKRKSKRKKYQTLEHFMRDVELMFENAKAYNEDDSDIYKDAVDLLNESRKLAEIEKAKPDEEYMMEDGRLPLPNGILYKNELWKVGDWVHIQNPNDVTKPIVAQIYRTWQDTEGQKWVNACWYYRPEQTVHQIEKHFYPNEVVKTGQYRDHQIEEVIDRCFVMFFTRYNRGRPRNLDPDKEVYVCEARYNEEKHKLNKIKTWASCLPDEVRDKDYEMDLFDAPRKIKKVPSPIKHLLKEGAKETDELPQPEWGHPNAPPRVGAVHCQPRDENQSPPPEPTPPPPPTPPPQPVRAPSTSMLPHSQARASIDGQSSASMSHLQPPRPSPSMTPQMTPYPGASTSALPPFVRPSSYQQSPATLPYAAPAPQTPVPHHTGPYAAQQQLHPPPSLSAAHPTSYSAATPSQAYGRPPVPPAQSPQYSAYAAGTTQTPRPVETYVLSESANATLPKEIRDQYPQDDQGRVLFFMTPPVDTKSFVHGRSGDEKTKALAHTTKYLAAKAERNMKISEAKRPLDAEFPANKRLKALSFEGEERDPDGRIKANPEEAAEIAAMVTKEEQIKEEKQKEALKVLCERASATLLNQHKKWMELFYRHHYGNRWMEWMEVDQMHDQQLQKEWGEEKRKDDEFKKYTVENPQYIYDFKKDPWKSAFKDDNDPRY